MKAKITGYGTEHFGKLKAVLLNRPYNALKRIRENNYSDYLWDTVPDIDKYLQEHEEYQKLLESLGIEVYLVHKLVEKNKELLNYLPNLAYMHDTAAVSSKGAIVSSMSTPARNAESIAVKEALVNLGIPIFHHFKEDEAFEGCLLISPTTMLIANTERHSSYVIKRFITKALGIFEQVIYVDIPQERRFMHPDMIFNRVTKNLALYFPPAYKNVLLYTKNGHKTIDFKTHMEKNQVELIAMNTREQLYWGSSFVPIEPGLHLYL
ncbi:arginine deiminase family protein [Clostridium sp. 'deep sea']|uniref:arginine deiminase family protein n=1 Tax=Clostridium sp. 'deep sea' TaxID=2779445 RepID=UPI001FAB8400|nr:arginine deiminase family protein [Clostridium sp. 'deep sea']